MGNVEKFKAGSRLGRPRKAPPKGYPMVTSRTGRDAEYNPGMGRALSEYATIPANFPFALYDIIDVVAVLDPYISRYVFQTVALGNPGHKLYVRASSEAKADEAILACNELAARCFPFAGGMDGVVNASLHQLARTGASCAEWVPDKGFTQIERVFMLPVRTLRFRYKDEAGTIELVQQQNMGKLVPLQPVQTTYHALTLRDTNPYPIPPIASALEASAAHRQIMAQIKTWVEKVSALGVLIASIEPPPREPNETQAMYDSKAQGYLDKLAATISENLNEGLGIGYNNIDFTFSNTQAGAQGAKDLLQLVVQGLFSGLQRDPIFFGWNMGSTETLARIVYQEMLQSLKLYQTGPKRNIEHGHRLNLALLGMGDVAVSASFKEVGGNFDVFKEAEATQMKATAVISQLEAEIITKEEARKLLGHEDKGVEAGALVATYNKEANRYDKDPYLPAGWTVQAQLTADAGEEDEETQDPVEERGGQASPDALARSGSDAAAGSGAAVRATSGRTKRFAA